MQYRSTIILFIILVFNSIESIGLPKENCSMNCQNGGVCTINNANNSICLCQSGWSGVLCQKCTSNTVCSNGFCDPIQGTCGCAFNNCQTTFVSCTVVYNCVNGGGCSLFDGKCKCPPGYSGQYCELKILPNSTISFKNVTSTTISGNSTMTSFVNCNIVNNCVNGGGCSLLDGACKCPPGYSGQYCELKIPTVSTFLSQSAVNTFPTTLTLSSTSTSTQTSSTLVTFNFSKTTQSSTSISISTSCNIKEYFQYFLKSSVKIKT